MSVGRSQRDRDDDTKVEVTVLYRPVWPYCALTAVVTLGADFLVRGLT